MQNDSPLRSAQQSLRRLSSKRSQIATGQHSSPTVFPEKRSRTKSRQNVIDVTGEDSDKLKSQEHRIDVGDEKSDLLGDEVFVGKLVLDKRPANANEEVQNSTETKDQEGIDAKLTRNALVWGSFMLYLEDVISVSYNYGLRHFTVHSYPTRKRLPFVSCFYKPHRKQKDFRFLASSSSEALQWVGGFADQQCYVNLLPHPLRSSMNQGSETISSDFLPEYYIKSKSPPRILVILNPRSGHGRSSKLFHGKVEPIFKLAGFKMEVVKTSAAGHAKNLASTVDFSTCPDGIVCVGGDGIINEVLNGLLSRNDQKEAISIPIGIIPAGSDNSLIWTVLGVKDPISAAIAIVKGGLTRTDVLAVEWIQTGIIHFGLTVSYFGFVSDVLELSEKYQKQFGPLRYFVAGFLKFLCLPKYNFEVEYLPTSEAVSDPESKFPIDHKGIKDVSDFYPDHTRKSTTVGIPRASSLSSIDSLMSPGRMSGDLDVTGSMYACSEPSEYVRGLDPKSKRLSSGKSNVMEETEEVIHSQQPLSNTPNWPRTRSKSRTDKGWTGLIASNDSRFSWGNAAVNDKEDISSTVSDPGPVWDAEPKWDTGPKWDTEPNWGHENPIELPTPTEDIEVEPKHEIAVKFEEKWVTKKGQFLGVLICNHSCRTVQSSQVVAPKAEHDDNALDLLLVHGSGRLKLARFFLLLQMGRHVTLPYVEYVKVKSVKIKAGGKIAHNGCGIDGEFLKMNGQLLCSLLPEQCRLIGRPVHDCI